VIQLPPTAIDKPSAMPLNTRPIDSSTIEFAPSASSSDPTAANTGAGNISGRRPKRSDSGPPINSDGTIPTT